MLTFNARTRRQLRVHVLRNIGGIYEGTASANGSTTTLVDNRLQLGTTDDHKGKFVYHTSTANANVVSRATGSSFTSNVTTITIAPAVTSTVTSDTYQLIGWPGYAPHPDQIHDALNQAILEVTGHYFAPIESVALCGDGAQARFDFPSTIHMIHRLQHRARVSSVSIHNAESAWDEAAAPSNVTRSVDTEDKKGGGANKFVIAGAFATGLVSSKAITSLDLSKHDYVEFWIKSTTATVSGDFTLLLDDTAACVSALETLTVPALAADTWTYVRVALANQELDTAIISVGLNAANNIAANTVWISQVQAVQNDSGVWEDIDARYWRVDRANRDLLLTTDARSQAGSHLLRLVGGARAAPFAAGTHPREG